MNKVLYGILKGIEVGCIIGLSGMALKLNNDCYKTKRELAETKLNFAFKDLECTLYKAENRVLNEKLEELQK